MTEITIETDEMHESEQEQAEKVADAGNTEEP